MITEGEIIYNNKSSLKDLNLKLENYPTIPLSTEEYEETTIVSRKGQLIENTGTYKNKHVTFEFTINKNDEMLNFDEIYDWLLNIKDNRFFYWQTNRCLRVKKVKFGDFKQEFRTFGTITLEFIFEPFWEDSEPTITTLTEDGSIMYYGTAPSSPIIKSNKVGRDAGCWIGYQGKLLRVSQDCTHRYGDNVHVSEITKLSPIVYEEKILQESIIPTDVSFYKEGGHQFNVINFNGKWIVATDAKEYHRLIGTRILHKIKSKL